MEFKIIDKPAQNFLLCYGSDEAEVERMIEEFLSLNNIEDKKTYSSEFRVVQNNEKKTAYMRYAVVPEGVLCTPGFKMISVPASKYLSCSLKGEGELYGKNDEAEEFLNKAGYEMDMAKLAPMIETTPEGKNLIVKLK